MLASNAPMVETEENTALSTALEEKPNAFFLALGKAIIKYQWLVILFVCIVSAFSAWQIYKNLKVDNSLEVFAPKNAPVMTHLESYRDIFGRDDLFMISVKGDILKAEHLKKLRALHQDLEELDVEVKTLGKRRHQRNPHPVQDAKKEEESKASKTENNDFGGEDFGSNQQDDWAEVKNKVVEEVTSLINVRRTYAVDGNLKVEKWLDGIESQAQIDQIKESLTTDPLIKNRLIDEAGSLTVFLVRIDFMSDDDTAVVYKAIDKLVEKYRTAELQFFVSGAPAVNAALNEVVLKDLSTLVTYSGLMMLFVLIYIFRRAVMVIGPMVIVSLSVLWTMGLMAALGLGLNLLSSILPAFLLCVGLGDSIHVQSIYLSLRRQGIENREAVTLSCGLTGIPVLFTSLTTMIGLFSFETATVSAIKEMGLAGGAGVFFALLLSLILLPIFLNLQNPKAEDMKENQGSLLIDRILLSFVNLSKEKRGRLGIILISLSLTLIAAYGMTLLKVRHDDLENLPPKHPIKEPILMIDSILGGTAAAEYLISFQNQNQSPDSASLALKNVEILKQIEAFTQHALNYRSPTGEKLVANAISITNIVKETKKAMLDGDDRMPQNQAEASQLLNLFELQSPSEFKKLATIDSQVTHISLQIKWKEATSYQHFIEYMEKGKKEIFAQSPVDINPTGGIYLAYTIVSSLLSDLMQSFGSAFVIICILMIFMLKNLKLGLLSMIPNLFPILIMLGLLGLLGIPLDLNNLLIASIALGIVVDDTIHFLHHFQMGYQLSQDCELGIDNALKHAGRAMLSTTMLLGAGFLVYLMATTTAIARFGTVIAFTIGIAFLADLILCPAILRIAYPKKHA